MMLGAVPISSNLTEGLCNTCSSVAVGEQVQFQQSLSQAASTQGVASPVTEAAPVSPTSEVSRTTTQAAPLGERILQNLSSLYRVNADPRVVAGGGPALPKAVEPGSASQPLLLQPSGAETSLPVVPQRADNFEAMLANLKDVSDGVIQVTLVSNCIGSVSSSLNKLISAG
ncbi:nodulation protein NolB [Bradyrhizobium sp. BR 1433]|uniref:nodulation protein NolB n=1 Tax=Bradyrhizobium sp. BR 1433 TaxID=3447967 RepID=UPI003EE43C58